MKAPTLVKPSQGVNVERCQRGIQLLLDGSLRLCRKEWITHSSGSLGLSHLFRAVLAELALHFCVLQYLGKANSLPCALISFAAHRDALTNGMDLVLDDVFSLRHGGVLIYQK
jgi:hypothetical protein